MKYAFDTSPKQGFKITHGLTSITGWIFNKSGCGPEEVVVCVCDQRLEAEIVERPDVFERYSSDGLKSLSTGFRLTSNLLKSGKHELTLEVQFPGETSPRFIVEKQIKIFGKTTKQTDLAKGQSRYCVDLPLKSKLIHWGSGLFTFRGWFADADKRPAKRVIGRIGRRIIIAETEARPDVSASLGTASARIRYGFKAEFTTGPGPKFLKIEVETEDGRAFEIHRQLLFNTIFNFRKDSYELWIKRRDTFYPRRLQDDLASLAKIEEGPTISVLLPTYNTDPFFLRKTVESVVEQIYPNWELCIADDASTSEETNRELKEIEKLSPKIKVTYREKNGHISEASNSALGLSTGDWVCFLDHDDLLSPRALLKFAEAIAADSKLRFIYSDEDKIDTKGRRKEPHFKTDWNPDLLYSQNYICHLTAIQKDLITAVGGFRKGLEGAQDHDLFLRTTQRLNAEQILHIPEVLYSWRMIEGSTATSSWEKDYTHKAGLKAVADLFGNSVEAVTDGTVANVYRVKFKIPAPTPKASIMIPMRDQADVTKQCIDSIFEKSSYENFEILILDNDSQLPATREYFEEIAKNPKIRIISYPKPFNYSAINNFGASHAAGDILVLLNNDIEVISGDWIEELVRHAVRPEIGCVGAKLYYPDDTIQHAGVIVGIGGVAGHSQKHLDREAYGYHSRLLTTQNYTAVTAACLAIRKETYQELDGFDENLAVAFNDVDFCIRADKKGYRNLWTPHCELYHHESKSRGQDDTPAKAARFKSEITYLKSKHDLKHDRFYNVNLDPANERFMILSHGGQKRSRETAL
ncbi:MAG: glycosyltransferase family 2 protein [Verrucomicrobiota bacterium]